MIGIGPPAPCGTDVDRWPNCIATLQQVGHATLRYKNPTAAPPGVGDACTMEHKDRILIVDDDPDIRQLLVDYLQRNGFEALPAASGREMAVMLEHHAIDLLVLDLMLPDADGLTLCRDLRARSSLPVLMLTARGEEADRILGIEMGADDYLVKPFSPRELLARIKASCAAPARCRRT
jgi:CheY-like chemotaxis protein